MSNQEIPTSNIRSTSANSNLRQVVFETLLDLSLVEFFETEVGFPGKADLYEIRKLHYGLKRDLLGTDWAALIEKEYSDVLARDRVAREYLANRDIAAGMGIVDEFTRLGISKTEVMVLKNLIQGINEKGLYFQSDNRGICQNLDIYLRLMKSNAMLVSQPLTIGCGVERREVPPIELDSMLENDPLAKFYEVSYGILADGHYHTRILGLSHKWLFVIEKT